jgi:5'-nucleotidase
MPNPASLSLLLLLVSVAVPPARAADDVLTRRLSSTVVEWRTPDPSDGIVVHLLAFNDLHGRLATYTHLQDSFDTRLVGGAASLAAWINAYRQSSSRSLVLIAGDSIGGSAPESGMLRDEPTMEFLNLLAADGCPLLSRTSVRAMYVATRCTVISTLGEHELDRGTAEFERLLYGGAHPAGPVLGKDWRGSHVPYLAANVRRKDGTPFLPPAALVDAGGLKIGIVGAVTVDTPAIVPPGRVDDLEFLPEVAPINLAVAQLRRSGASAVILLIHEGLTAPITPQGAAVSPEETRGRLTAILTQLDPGVDVVVSGHTHAFTNLLLRVPVGPPLLVTQARSYGTAFTDIELVIDPRGHRVLEKAADGLTAWADEGPGHHPDEKVQKLVAAAQKAIAPTTQRLITVLPAAILREPAVAGGESPLGELIADAYRRAAGTDFAVVNPGSVRDDVPEGQVTFGALYEVLPFGNTVVRLSLTGEQVARLLESQWSEAQAGRRLLSVSGFTYLYNPRLTPGRRVVAVYDGSGAPLKPTRRYTLATTDFLRAGGEHNLVLAEGTDVEPVALDVAALEAYVTATGTGLKAPSGGRLTRIGEP